MDGPERLARARTRDAVLSLACYAVALVCNCLITSTGDIAGSSWVGILVLCVLLAFSLGLAVSGLRSTRSWARALSCLVLLLALVHLLEPRIILAGVRVLL
jgi:hypothetical protein